MRFVRARLKHSVQVRSGCRSFDLPQETHNLSFVNLARFSIFIWRNSCKCVLQYFFPSTTDSSHKPEYKQLPVGRLCFDRILARQTSHRAYLSQLSGIAQSTHWPLRFRLSYCCFFWSRSACVRGILPPLRSSFDMFDLNGGIVLILLLIINRIVNRLIWSSR